MGKIFKLRKTVFLSVATLFCCLSYPQEKYLQGFVIKNNGDTLKGFVDYRNWRINPEEVNFKSAINSASVSFIPTEIKEFSVNDEIYVSGIIEVENTHIEETRLDYDSRPKITVDTIFLQTLIQGEKGLYYYMNSNGRENFYIKKDSGFELLVYRKYLFRQGTTSLIRENKDYIGQLNLYFVDCPAIRTRIGNTAYAQKSLIRLFQDYYECSSSEIIAFQREGEKVHLGLGTLAGVSLTKLKISTTDPDFDYLENTDFKLSTSFSGGLSFDIIIPRNQARLSIDNELLFSMYKTNGQYEYLDYNDTYKKFTTEFQYSYLKLNTMLRYRFPVGKMTLFCNAGVSNGIRLSETQYVKKEFTTEYSGTTVYEGTPLVQTKQYEQGLIVGTGIKANNISFEARLEIGDGMINVPSLNAWATRYYFILGYRFK